MRIKDLQAHFCRAGLSQLAGRWSLAKLGLIAMHNMQEETSQREMGLEGKASMVSHPLEQLQCVSRALGKRILLNFRHQSIPRALDC